MIDLHMHILPDLDDGAIDWRQSIEMAKLAAENGTTAIVATPHSYARRGYYELYPDDIEAKTAELNRRIAEAGLSLRVYTGMEVLIDSSVLPLLNDGRMLTLGTTRWLLTEFYGDESADEITALLRAVRKMGYTPLVAHAERYKAFQKHPDLAAAVCEMGGAIQVNARAVSGDAHRKYVKTARRLCEKGWAQIVASDGHNTTTRLPLLNGAYDWLAETCSKAFADRLTEGNPRALLAGCTPSELLRNG